MEYNHDHPIFLTIDGGTGGIRVGLYNHKGDCLSFATKEYRTDHPKPGYAMQDPFDWWNTLKDVIPQALDKANIQADQIDALALDTTCTSVVVCKKDGTPLYPSIIWMDVRAAKEAEELLEKTNEFYSPEWMPPKLAWLKRNERKIYDQAEVFCEYQDWLTFKLTGKWCMNNNTACNWGYSIYDGFSEKIYEALDITDAIDRFPGPVLILHGDEDDMVPLQDSVDAAKRYRDARLEVIRGETHHFDRHPEIMKDLIRSWLISQSGI